MLKFHWQYHYQWYGVILIVMLLYYRQDGTPSTDSSHGMAGHPWPTANTRDPTADDGPCCNAPAARHRFPHPAISGKNLRLFQAHALLSMTAFWCSMYEHVKSGIWNFSGHVSEIFLMCSPYRFYVIAVWDVQRYVWLRYFFEIMDLTHESSFFSVLLISH